MYYNIEEICKIILRTNFCRNR